MLKRTCSGADGRLFGHFREFLNKRENKKIHFSKRTSFLKNHLFGAARKISKRNRLGRYNYDKIKNTGSQNECQVANIGRENQKRLTHLHVVVR